MSTRSLLALPAEIRLMILRNVLHETEIVVWFEWEWEREREQFDYRTTSNACGNVLRTCQQMRNEGTSILYGENVFSIASHYRDLFNDLFLPTIGPDNVSMIKHIKFNVDTSRYDFRLDPALPSMGYLHPQFRNLRKITWEITRDSLRENLFEDWSFTSTMVRHAVLCSQHLPQFSMRVRFDPQQPGNPRSMIIISAVRE